MSIGLFLGAGASVPYNYKTTLEMKKHILEYASEIFSPKEHILIEKLVNFHTCTDIEYVLDLVIKIARTLSAHVKKSNDIVPKFRLLIFFAHFLQLSKFMQDSLIFKCAEFYVIGLEIL